MKDRRHYVMDYETLSNCFVAVFIDTKSDQKKEFVIHESRNDIQELLAFLWRNKELNEFHVSFNGLGFDSQITQYIMLEGEYLAEQSGSTIARWIYSKAQSVIERSNAGEFLEFRPYQLFIKQVDVYKLNHWDNPAKRSSLKWIQYSMDWKNIMDMPIHHSTNIKDTDIPLILKYCNNDVESTKAIMMKSKELISLRQILTKDYGIDFYSSSEPRISKELFLHFLSKETGISKYELRELRTFRSSIAVNNLILPYVNFKTAPFQKLLTTFQSVVIDPNNTKNAFKYSMRYKGVTTDFGLGGVHGARESGIYESDEDMVIVSSDVESYYPNLAIKNGWSPAHLPSEVFCPLYEWFFTERKKIPKKDPRNYVYKIILNSTYGLSNDKNSFLYDPEFTMRITMNGQLSLMMLYEMISEAIPDAKPLMQNTDGLETLIPRKDLDTYMKICAEWEAITKLKLEHGTYQKLFLGDVNNYIAVFEPKEVSYSEFLELKKKFPHNVFNERDGKYFYSETKCKGRFEFEGLALHKNKSFLIVPKAVFNYFVHGTDPKDFIQSSENIFDFCGGVKIKGDWKFVEHLIEKEIDPQYLNYTVQQKRDYLKANGWEESWSEDNWVRSDSKSREANNGRSTENAFLISVPKVGGAYVTHELQHTLRYYISNSGSKIIKVNKSDAREIQIESGSWMQTLFIDYVDKAFDEYDLNFSFYEEKIEREINAIKPKFKQLQLF